MKTALCSGLVVILAVSSTLLACTNVDPDWDDQAMMEGGRGDAVSTGHLSNNLAPQGVLSSNQYLVSPNGKYRLYLQGDGNLVLRSMSTGKAMWATGTHGKSAKRLYFQGDGNLVLRTAAMSAVWASHTDGSGATLLKLNDDGSLALYRGNSVVWSVGGAGGGAADDLCPSDPKKTAPGACGCGVPDIDSDGDGTADCHDCAANPSNPACSAQCGDGVCENGETCSNCGTDCCQAGNGDGRIIYPWRVTTAIARRGETFEVWFDAKNGQTVEAVQLKSRYATVNVPKSTKTGNWVYDPTSGGKYNTKVAVTVPVDIPADRYDLVLRTSRGNVTSTGAVKAIQAYKKKYYILHMSDAHRWHKIDENTNNDPYQSWNIMRAVDVLVGVANIIDPEMIFETGDNVYNIGHPSHPEIEDTWAHGWPSLGLKGMADAHAATFAVAGNHDAPGNNSLNGDGSRKPFDEVARYYDKWYGVQAFNVQYGNGRYMGVNNGWHGFDYAHQRKQAIEWLGSVGAGNLRVGLYHQPGSPATPFYNDMKANGLGLGLMLAGHTHSGAGNPYDVSGKQIEYRANGFMVDGNKVPFNLFLVDDNAGIVQPVGNAGAAHQALTGTVDFGSVRLALTYSQANNGTRTANSARVVNKFAFPIYGARMRFVMKKGQSYTVSRGSITQVFDGDSAHVVDVMIDIGANSTTVVDISAG